MRDARPDQSELHPVRRVAREERRTWFWMTLIFTAYLTLKVMIS